MPVPHHNGNYEDPVLRIRVQPRNAHYLAVDMLPDGRVPHVYERSTLERILTTNPISPMSRRRFGPGDIRSLVNRAVTRSATREAARAATRNAAAAAAAAATAAAAARTAALASALTSLRREARVARIPIAAGGITAAVMAQKLETPAWFGLGLLARRDSSYMWQVRYKKRGQRSRKLGIFSRRRDDHLQLVICDFYEHEQPHFAVAVVVDRPDEFVNKFLHFIHTKMAEDSSPLPFVFTSARRYRRVGVAPLVDNE